jgi:CopG family nickel-responsive transcriptional regulator
MRVALDHDRCLEVAVLKWKVAEVKHFAQKTIAERVVHLGWVNIIPAEIESARYPHGHRHARPHHHIRIR